MNKKIFIVLIVFSLLSNLTAQSDFFTFQVVLRPENLYALTPRPSDKDFKELAGLVSQYKDFFDSLLTNPENWSEAIEREKSCNKMFAMLQLKNLGDGNYVFEVGDKFIIKIAGHVNRARNLLYDCGNQSYEAFCVNKIHTWSMIDSYISTQQPTYLTASRAANYLMASSIMQQYDFEKSIQLPQLSVATLDGSADVRDTNVIVVEQKITDLQPLSTYLQEHELPEQMVSDLILFVAKTGIGSLQDVTCANEMRHNLFVSKEGKIVIVDLEQPITSCPTHAFFRISDKVSRENYELNIVHALQQLREFFEVNSKPYYIKILDDFVATHR